MKYFLDIIADQRSAVTFLKKLPSLNDQGYGLGQLENFVKSMFDQHCPLKVGDIAELVETPVITETERWGWIGSKHFLIAGRKGIVETVGWNEGFQFGWRPENQTWVDSSGAEKPIEKPHIYNFGEGWLKKIQGNGTA